MLWSSGKIGVKPWLVGLALILILFLAPKVSWGDLIVDGAYGNSPYILSASSLTNASVTVGITAAGGVFNQWGGANTASDSFTLGLNAGSNGAYNLHGGTLSAYNVIIGDSGNGSFSQNAGTNNVGIPQGGCLTLGNAAGSQGAYILQGGDLGAMSEVIGNAGSGSFTQSGGTHWVDIMTIGNAAGSSGVYNLQGGRLDVFEEVIGTSGSGNFIQTGGTHFVSMFLHLGSNGSYTLNGGNLIINEALDIGSGSFTQTGGSNKAYGFGMFVGPGGAYNLQGGSLWAFSEYLGGRFTQSGGDHSVNSELAVNGTYSLSGGRLAVGYDEVIGYSCGAGFFQSGGTHTVNILSIGGWSSPDIGDWSGNGSYALSGGSLTATTEIVGNVGSGSLLQTGGDHTVAGTLTLGNTVGSAGFYHLSGGSLSVGEEVIGDWGSGTLVQTGGVHTIAGDLTLAANPGSRGSLAFLGGTLTVGGNYTQNAGGNLALGIASGSNYQSINIGGTASLNGALTPVLLGGYRPQANQVFTGVLTAAGGITGAFSEVGHFTPTLLGVPLYAADRIDLLVQRNYTNPGLSLSANQAAVGAMLNGLAGTASGDLNTVLDAIDGLPTNAAVQNALKQISPEKAAALPTLAFAWANFQMRQLAQRITDLRFGAREAGFQSALGSFNLNSSRQEALMLAYHSSSLAGLATGKRPVSPQNRWGLYLEPALVLGAQKSSADQTGFSFTMAGFSAGADYRVRDDLLVGLATGYTKTDAGFYGSGGGVQTDTWPLTAYAAYLPQPFYACGSLGYALNLFNLERELNFGGLNRTARSSPVGHQLNAYAEAGYDLKAGSLVVTPVASLAYSGLWVDGFTESGAGALNLRVASQKASSLQSGVGAKIAAPLKRGPVTVVPQAYASYRHEFAHDSRGLNAGLSQAGSTFTFQTDAVKRDFAVVGAKVDLRTDKNYRLELNYNAEVGRSDYTAHSIYAGVRWEF